ncbi:MAG: restriction endonuclease subunit S [Gemmataceae bacterium]|nr:restriction endonuclease subunit S [Gemmataceae bacterium]
MGSEWRTVEIGSLCDGIYDGPHATPPTATEGPVFLGISSLTRGRLDLTNTEHISEADFPRWTRRVQPRLNDLVFSYETRLGEAALIPDGLRCCLGRRMALARPRPDLVDPRFLLYAYLAPEFQEVIQSRTIHGSTVDRIPLTEFPKFPIRVPPLAEQRAIAGVLGALDDKIAANRRLARTLEALGRAVFRSWFVDFDPVTARAAGRRPVGMTAAVADLFPAAFADSPLGPIPEGWRAGSVADLARYVNGRNFTKNATGTGRMVIRIAELNSGPGGSTVYNDVTAPPENTAYPGELLFAWSGSLDVYRWHGDEALVNQHIFKVIPAGYPQWFVHYHLIEAMPFFQGIAADKATTMGHIKREHLSHAELALPHNELLAAADLVIQPLYAKLHHCERQSRTLAALRDALLPRLLSGELRVRAAGQWVAEAGA